MRRLAFLTSGLVLVIGGYGLYRTLLDDLPAATHEAGNRPENRVAIFGSHSVGQTFRPPLNLSAIDLTLFGPPGVSLKGNALLHLRRSPDSPVDLRTAEAPLDHLRKDVQTRFRFPVLDTRGEPRLFLLLEFTSGTAERPLFARAERPMPDRPSTEWHDYPDGSLYLNGQATEGDLAFRLFQRGRRPFGLQVAAAAFLGGLSLLAGALAQSIPAVRAHTRRVTLATLAVGLPVIFFTPLLTHPTFLGTGDWDMNTTLHAAAERALLAEQVFPGWNPYLCGGTPLAAFPEAPVFSPLFGTVLLGGPVSGFKANIVLHGVIGFLGMLVWLRRGLRVSWPAAFLGAATVLFSSFVGLHLSAGHSRKVAIAWIPWVLFFFQRAVQDVSGPKTKLRDVVPAAAFLALMFYDGSVYLTSYTALFLIVLGAFEASLRRNWRPIAISALTLVLAGFLAGARLVPTVVSQTYLHRVLDQTNAVLPLRSLVDIFLDPNQDPFAVKFDPQPQPWFEYGAYVGVTSLIFAVFGFALGGRRILPWAGTGLVFLLGATTPAAQRVIDVLPLIGNLRNPQRMAVMVTVVAGLAAALGFDRITRWLAGSASTPGSTMTRSALGVLAAISISHLIFVNSGTLANTFTVPAPAEELPLQDKTPPLFRQGWARPYLAGETDSFAFTADNFARNRGSLNRCSIASIRPSEALRVPKPDAPPETAAAFTDLPYEGEIFFLAGRGKATVSTYETTRVTAAYTAETTGVLALNENFHPGWRVTLDAGHEPPQTSPGEPARSLEGLVSVPVSPGSGFVTFTYRTPHLGAGLAVSLVGFAASLWLIRRRSTDAT